MEKIKTSQKDLCIVLSNEDVTFTALSYYCVSLKEKVAGKEGKWKERKKKENLYADILQTL